MEPSIKGRDASTSADAPPRGDVDPSPPKADV